MPKPFYADSDSDEATPRFRKNKPIFTSSSDESENKKKPETQIKKPEISVSTKSAPLSFQNSESSDDEYDYKKRTQRSANG